MAELDTPIRGELVALRTLEESDIPLLKHWINDPEVTETLAARYPFSTATEQQWYEKNTAPGFERALFIIVTGDGGIPIGSCDLTLGLAENRDAELGIMIGEKSYWNRGYGTDAVRTLVRFAFEEMNLNRIQLEVFDFNARAIRAYEKVGFQREGTLREAHYQRGAYLDVELMSILRRDWDAPAGRV